MICTGFGKNSSLELLDENESELRTLKYDHTVPDTITVNISILSGLLVSVTRAAPQNKSVFRIRRILRKKFKETGLFVPNYHAETKEYIETAKQVWKSGITEFVINDEVVDLVGIGKKSDKGYLYFLNSEGKKVRFVAFKEIFEQQGIIFLKERE